MADERSDQEVARRFGHTKDYPYGWYADYDLQILSEATKAGVHGTCEGALVEVGVYRGYSANVICRQAAGRPVYLIDSLELAGASPKDWPVGENVKHVVSRLTKWDDGPICVAHHDADHSFEVTHEHFEILGPHILLGGILAIHDFHELPYPGVKQAWDAFSLKGDFEPWGHGYSIQVFQRARK